MSPQTSGRFAWVGSWTLIEELSDWSSFSVTTFSVVTERPSRTSWRFAQMRGLVAVGSLLHDPLWMCVKSLPSTGLLSVSVTYMSPSPGASVAVPVTPE